MVQKTRLEVLYRLHAFFTRAFLLLYSNFPGQFAQKGGEYDPHIPTNHLRKNDKAIFVCRLADTGFLCFARRVSTDNWLFPHPIEGALYSPLPATQLLIPLCGGNRWQEGALYGPVALHILLARPEAHGQSRQIGGAQGRGLHTDRAVNLRLQNVRLELHQEIVGTGAAVHLQGVEGDAGISAHGVQHVADLIGDGFQRGADDVVLVHPPGQSYDGPPGVLIPVGRAQAGKSGHYIAPGGITDLPGVILAVCGGFDEAHLVPEPLNGRPGHKDRSLQRILHPAPQAPGNGGYQTVLGEDGFFAGIHQQEAACAVCVFGLPRLEAGLAKQRRLLIARRPGDGDGGAEEGGVRLTVDAAAGLYLGQHTAGNI